MEADSQQGFVETSETKGEGIKPPPKARSITKKDWQNVESHIKDELDRRKNSSFRKRHERIWKEVDRQVAMESMVKLNRDGSQVDTTWHSVIELGELSKASENISADVRRILFPAARFWFEPHSRIDTHVVDKKKKRALQEGVDGRVRSMMMQQHLDFGLKDRVELSVKEALHHGSFVVEIDWDTQEMIFEGTKTKSVGAPVWQPHSMWNSYPDPSPAVIGTNMFYTGSMLIESYKPRYQCEQDVKSDEDGWMPSQWKKVSKDEHVVKGEVRTKDVKLVTYWGDLVMERSDGDLYFPNHKAVLMNGTLVYMAPLETPYVPIIYRGYERMDVRDPYHLSPIIKQSPAQKLASTLANKYIDGVGLKIEPPIVYDGNDPDFVLNGGPVVEPGSKTSTKGKNAFSQVEIGDPNVALQGLEFFVGEMKEKLGRPGKPVGDRATKAEVVKSAQDQEVSVVDFIDKMEVSLRCYLYQQHAMNLTKLTEYSYYSPEMEDPDFLVAKRADLPKAVHFEVVGARGVLGEEERSQKMSVTTAFFAGNPFFAPRLEIDSIMRLMYSDAGVKNPERLLKDDEHEDPAQLKMMIQKLNEALQQMGGELQQEKAGNAVKLQKVSADHAAKMAKIDADHKDKEAKLVADHAIKSQKIAADVATSINELRGELTLAIAKEHAKPKEQPKQQETQT